MVVCARFFAHHCRFCFPFPILFATEYPYLLKVEKIKTSPQTFLRPVISQHCTDIFLVIDLLFYTPHPSWVLPDNFVYRKVEILCLNFPEKSAESKNWPWSSLSCYALSFLIPTEKNICARKSEIHLNAEPPIPKKWNFCISECLAEIWVIYIYNFPLVQSAQFHLKALRCSREMNCFSESLRQCTWKLQLAACR